MEWSELQVATFAGMAAGLILMIVAVIGVGLCYHRPRLGRAFRCLDFASMAIFMASIAVFLFSVWKETH